MNSSNINDATDVVIATFRKIDVAIQKSSLPSTICPALVNRDMTKQEPQTKFGGQKQCFRQSTIFVMVAESEEALANGVANIIGVEIFRVINDFRQVALLSDQQRLPHVRVSVITNTRSTVEIYLCLTRAPKPFTKTLLCRKFSVLCVPF